MKKKNILTPIILTLGIAIGGIFPEKEALSQTIQICSSSAIPTGFVVTGVSTNFAQCGGGFNNILTIQNASILRPGSSLSICSSSAIPTGFVVTGVSTSLAECYGGFNNIVTIRRVF
ncbi:hypothetical protein GXM_00976 [Nostoc sphaeroides CCNUC1]|uniref:Uncharacterized protein n=2 Tax=Nostoc sphaeroides TaxID=446679 RepID=A0A5P8VSZ1_9NOSO|nr:hypothetical protein GXM_00976 [Nostoc sphaeroides CCNUC1]